MSQPSLFDRPRLRVASVPATRVMDPPSSAAAEREHTISGRRETQAARVYALVCAHPGLTAGELAAMCELDSVQVTRRLNDLHRLGKIVQGRQRQCQRHMRMMVTWRPEGEGA